MGLLETFERAHVKDFSRAAAVELTRPSLKTPDGREWRLDEIIRGWQSRPSDHWAYLTLHCWIAMKEVEVGFVELPCELRQSTDRLDPARSFVEQEFGPGEYEVTLAIGRVDYFCYGSDVKRTLAVEFGTCAPAKFVFNAGASYLCDHMIVPYDCPYAFVFTPQRALLTPFVEKSRRSSTPRVKRRRR